MPDFWFMPDFWVNDNTMNTPYNLSKKRVAILYAD